MRDLQEIMLHEQKLAADADKAEADDKDALQLRRLLQMQLPRLLLERQTLQTLKSSWLQCTPASTMQMPWNCATHQKS